MKVGDRMYIDGVVPCTVYHLFEMGAVPTAYVVVELHPFIVRGTFDRIEPTKEAAVSKLVVHPENLTIESKVRAENLATAMHDPSQSES